jgi:hypothetical protein
MRQQSDVFGTHKGIIIYLMNMDTIDDLKSVIKQTDSYMNQYCMLQQVVFYSKKDDSAKLALTLSYIAITQLI